MHRYGRQSFGTISLFDIKKPDQHDRGRKDDRRYSPSVVVVFLSTACGISGGVLGLYVALDWFYLSVQVASAVATLAACFAVAAAGVGLSAFFDSRATTANIGLSCALIVLSLFFFGLCSLLGAIAASLLLGGVL